MAGWIYHGMNNYWDGGKVNKSRINIIALYKKNSNISRGISNTSTQIPIALEIKDFIFRYYFFGEYKIDGYFYLFYCSPNWMSYIIY